MWCFGLIIVRGGRVRTYHLAFIMETVMAFLWILPTYALVEHIRREPGRVPIYVPVTLTFVLLNL